MVRFVESDRWPQEGPVSIWEEPQWGHAYVIGADVAEGLEHGDFSDASVLDVDGGLLVAKWHGHIDVDLFGEELNLLGRWYNNALIGVESNAMGIATVAALRRKQYPRLFRRRVVGQVSEKFTPQWGWHTNKATKAKMIPELAKALRDRAIDIRDEYTLAELRTYIRDEKAQMHGSPHDDRVMSLAIAVQMLDYAHVPEFEPPQRDSRYTFDWWVKKARETDSTSEGPRPIGYHQRRHGTGRFS